MSQAVVEITDASFESDVLQSSTPTLVDFWAPWCQPCKMIAPHLDKLAEEFTGRVKICKLNVGDGSDVASQFQVQGIPTLLMFVGGALVGKLVGAVGKAQLEAFINEHLN